MHKPVKRMALLFVAGLLAAGAYTAAAQEPVGDGDVKITITTDKEEYAAGDTVGLSYSVENTNILPGIRLTNVQVTTQAAQTLQEMGVVETSQKANQLLYGYPLTNDMAAPVDNGRGVYAKIVPADEFVSDSITFADVNRRIERDEAQAAGRTEASVLPAVCGAAVLLAVAGCLAAAVFLRKRKKRAATALSLVFCLLVSAAGPAASAESFSLQDLDTRTQTYTQTAQILVDGVPQEFKVSVQLQAIYENPDIQYYDDNTETSVLSPDGNNAIPHDADPYEDWGVVMRYISNDQIKLGANLALGGSITYLASVEGGISDNTHNIVNNYDFGRQIQMSAYAGPSPYYVPGKTASDTWASLGWNPIQAGDAYNHGSRVIAFYQTSDFMYIKLRPNHWPYDDAPGECTFEVTYRLVDNCVDVQYRINMERVDWTEEEIAQLVEETGQSAEYFQTHTNTQQYYATTIEAPAVYVNGNWYKNVTYTGTKPFTNDSLTETINFVQTSASWTDFICTESWMAFVTADTGYGLGLYNPRTTQFIAGFGGEKGGPNGNDDRGYSTGYMTAGLLEIMDYNLAYDGGYTLILGTVEQIRGAVYDFNGTNEREQNYDFTQNNRLGWNYGSDWASYITDKGYLNQDCLDFQLLEEGGILVSPNTFFTTQSNKTLEIDAAFTRDEAQEESFLVNLRFTLYAGVPLHMNASDQYAYVPVRFTADGQRRTYTISLEDCYEYASALGCRGFRLEFPEGSGDIHAQIYSIRLT